VQNVLIRDLVLFSFIDILSGY